MPAPTPVTDAERRVLVALVAGFLALAAAGLAFTWWAGTRECRATCIAQGRASGAMHVSGGGRYGMRPLCTCAQAPGGGGTG